MINDNIPQGCSIKKPLIIYSYKPIRTKFGIPLKSADHLKKKLIEERGQICEYCKQNVPYPTSLDLEHNIPVYVGGHGYNEQNLFLICKKCHDNKTALDRRAIFIMKQIGIIIPGGFGSILSFYNLKEVQIKFLEIRQSIKEIDLKKEIYKLGENGKDYKIVYQESNKL